MAEGVTSELTLCTHSHLQVFRRKFADYCGLKSCAVMVVGIVEGSIVITMLVPESVESTIRSLDPEFIEVHSITHIMFKGFAVYSQVSIELEVYDVFGMHYLLLLDCS